jgi:hypothetical protein
MGRLVVFAAFAASVLIVTTGAQAKAPPSGFEVCGAQTCTAISAFAEAEPLAIGLWFGGDEGSAELAMPMAPPAPFFVLHWAFQPGDVHTGYYVPQLNLFRYVGDPSGASNGKVHWMKLGTRSRTILERLTATLEPFPAPVPSRVTVAGKPCAIRRATCACGRSARRGMSGRGAASFASRSRATSRVRGPTRQPA